MSTRPLVLYHGPSCADGFASAWVAWRKFGDQADYIPVQYGQEPPNVTDRYVYILDFSYKMPVLKEMARRAQHIEIQDHHKTAKAEFPERDGFIAVPGDPMRAHYTFDMEKSGARLTWELFFRSAGAPWLVDYTEDRDLWRWRLPYSREVSAAIASYPFNFTLWDVWADVSPCYDKDRNQLNREWLARLAAGWANPHRQPLEIDTAQFALLELVDEGGSILRYQSQLVESICASAHEVEISGQRILAATTPVLQSEVAGKLAEGRPFGACYFTRSDGVQQWSLRSRDGGLDVSEIAKAHGGGGHRNAAGFEKRISPVVIAPVVSDVPNWKGPLPPVNRQMVEESRKAYERGEGDSISDLIERLKG